MIYAQIVLGALTLLVAAYYAMVIGQLFGAWKITQRQFTFTKLCVPFYYWIVSQKVNKPTKNHND